MAGCSFCALSAFNPGGAHATTADQPAASSHLSCDVVTIEAGGQGMGSWKVADQQHYKAEMVDWLKEVLAPEHR
jgi:hypothetical protein